MKKSAVLTVLLSGSAAVSSLFAQGSIVWGNVIGTTFAAPIYGVDPANPTLIRNGNVVNARPAPPFGGALLQGTGFTIAIYTGGNAAEATASLNALDSTTFRTGAAAGFMWQRTATDPQRPAGTTGVNVQIRAWDNQMGTVTSWAEVLAHGGQVAGAWSIVFTVGPLGGVASDGTVFIPPRTTRFYSFQLTQVPEPSLIALGALGLGALLLRRRK